MHMNTGIGAFARGWLAMAGRKSPWGGGKNGDGDSDGARAPGEASGNDPSDDEPPPSDPPPTKGPRNPWLPPQGDGPRRSASMEDILRQRRPGGGGGGGGPRFPKLPPRPDGKSWGGIIAAIVVLLWLGVSTTHMLSSNEQGIVTTLGKYTRTIGSGVALTLPWPIEQVSVEDVTSIKRDFIPDGDAEKLMITGDQNLVDISYLVRWNIKDLRLYTFQLDDPKDTVKEVAEAAMRAAIAEVPLKDVMSNGRARIETNVRERMQAILDAYRSGISIQGIDIKKTDPPAKVVEAFQKVTGAQQDAQRARTSAQAWAQQVLSQAQGNAAEFDKVYEQYKLSPEVTKRRLYYETMERVLANNDKVVVEAPGVTSYLPLPEIKRTAPTPATPEAGGQ